MFQWERRVRSRTGLLVPYHTVRSNASAKSLGRYVRIPPHFRPWETPRGLFSDLPPVLTYGASALIADPSAGAWSLFYTEWTAKVVCALLWGLYPSLWLFWLPQALRDAIMTVNVTQFMGGVHNYREVCELVGRIWAIAWVEVPESNRCRSQPMKPDQLPGRDAAGGDYVLFDPWTR